MKWNGMWAWLAICLAGVLAVRTVAADLETELGELSDAVSARITATESQKEEKKLLKAKKKIVNVELATADAKALAKILSAVFGSKTVDETVLGEAQDVLDCLRLLAEAEKTTALEFLDDLESKFASKLEAKIAGGDKRLESGLSLVEENPRKAAALFRKALEKYIKSQAFAEKALKRQEKSGGGGKLGNKPRVIATIKGDGLNVKFNEFGVTFSEFGQLGVFGCDARGPDGVCKTSLGFTISYDSGSRETGIERQTFITYTDSSDFAGGAVQDLSWSGTATVTVEESTNKLIKGRFTATASSDTGQDPQTVTIQGTWVVRRPKN